MRPITKLSLAVRLFLAAGVASLMETAPLQAQAPAAAIPVAATQRVLAPEDLPPTTDMPAEASAPPSASATSTGPVPQTPAAATPGTVPAAAPVSTPPTATASVGAAPAAPAPSAVADSADRNSIMATVDDVPISEYDVRQRVQLRVALSPVKPSAEDLKRLHDDTLQLLEDEKVEYAEAGKRHLTVSPVDINKTIDSLLAKNKMTHAQLTKALTDAGSSEAALREQYTASEVWQKVVQQEFSDDVNANITAAMVDDAMRREAEGATKTHYDVLEIFLPSSGPEQDAKVLQTAQGVAEQLKTATFPDVAREYSRNPSAAAGGEIGWVYDGQLEPALNEALSKMKKGDLSAPIRGTGGYYILGLRDRQEPLGTDVTTPETVAPSSPPGTLPLARLLLPVGGLPPDQLELVKKTALQIQANVTSCDQLKKLSEDQLKGSVYMDPLQFAKLIDPGAGAGFTKLADVSEDIQKAVAGTKSGDIAMPFQDEAGIEIIARCDPRPGPPRTAFTMPTREQVELNLFQDRMSVLSRRYLRELRQQANIQERGPNGKIVDAALANVH